MIPVPDNALTQLNFDGIAKTDKKYADLLRTEYSYCSAHIDEIKTKASSVYNIGCNPKHVLNKFCCNFKLLESRMSEYYL